MRALHICARPHFARVSTRSQTRLEHGHHPGLLLLYGTEQRRTVVRTAGARFSRAQLSWERVCKTNGPARNFQNKNFDGDILGVTDGVGWCAAIIYLSTPSPAADNVRSGP